MKAHNILIGIQLHVSIEIKVDKVAKCTKDSRTYYVRKDMDNNA
jgi:hypothetical protein